MSDNPYTDHSTNKNTFLREFNENVESHELVWHRDRRDRQVKILKGEGWQLQFDNQLPFTLSENQTVFIPKNTYHRIHKGSTDLVVEITEDEAN
jgi:quercetin dioxygenase-like cupin family protein